WAFISACVLWIGVLPDTLSNEDAYTSANSCLNLLQQFGINDVEVEFRASIYTKSAGLGPLDFADDDPMIDFRRHLTPVLGLSIAGQATPHHEGTGGLYFSEGGDSKNVFLLTARHVLFPPSEGSNDDYTHASPSESEPSSDGEDGAPRRNVMMLGPGRFDKLVKSINDSIWKCSEEIERYERTIEWW
ncbi:hypothetical protein H0H81_012113, partial [Sphagnurus paluster]